jgi:hypothetical protein
METQRNNQRSLLEGGVGSRHAPVSAFSVKVAIKSEGEQLHYPSRVRANSNLLLFGYQDSSATSAGAFEARLCRAGFMPQPNQRRGVLEPP